MSKASYKSYGGYNNFLLSKKWRRKRNRVFKINGRFCFICGTRENLTIHHPYYSKRPAHEKNADLVVVCWFHHQEIHKFQKENSKEVPLRTAHITYKQYWNLCPDQFSN